MLYKTEEYKSSITNFPSHDVSEAKKLEPEYGAAFAEAIYSSWCRGRFLTSPDLSSRIKINKAYARGEQSVLPYQGYFFGDMGKELDEDVVRDALMNIDWTPVAAAVKFVNVLLNTYDDADLDMMISAVDPDSREEKLRQRSRIKAKMMYRQAIEQINKEAQADVIPLEEDLPQDEKQLMFMEQFGMLRLDKEIAYEAALGEINDRCNAKEIKRNLLMDLICGAACCIREYVDPVDHKLKKEWCDLETTIISFGSKQYVNPEYAGVLKQYTIAEIKELTGWEDDELKEFATGYCGYVGNPATYDPLSNYWDDAPEGTSYSSPAWYNTRVLVLEYEFLTVNKSYRTTRTNEDGTTSIFEESYSKKGDPPKVYDTDKRKTNVSSVAMRMVGSWIVGTKKAFNHNYQNDIARVSPKECGSSFHYYAMKINKPLIEVMMPHIDGMTMCMLDIRNLQAKAPGPGFYIDVDSISDMTMGAGALTELDIVRMGTRGGVMFYKGSTSSGYMPGEQRGGVARPVEFYPGGFGPKLQELIALFEFHRRQIQELIGLPDIAVAGVQKRETTLGEQQITYAASMNAVKHYLSAIIEIEKNSSMHIIHRLKLIAKYNPEGYSVMRKALGFQVAESFHISKEDTAADIGIEIMPFMSQSKKEMILSMAQRSKSFADQGGVGITQADLMKIIHFLDSGRLRQAEFYFAYREHEEKEYKQKLVQENQAANAKAAMETEQLKNKNEQDLEKLKSLLDKDEMTHEYKLKTQGMAMEKAADALTQGAMAGASQMAQPQQSIAAPTQNTPEMQPM